MIIIGLGGFWMATAWGGKSPKVQPEPSPQPAPVVVYNPVTKRTEPEPQPEPVPEPAKPRKPLPPPKPVYADKTDANAGAVMFVCTDSSHEEREAVIRMCGTCAKRDRFVYDYDIAGFKCIVCNTELKDFRCDDCGNPPPARRRIHLKKNVGRG